jgi:hypothetical protein
VLAEKRYVFGVKIGAFLLFVALYQHALTPAIRRYFFANAAQVLIMFWHNFG